MKTAEQFYNCLKITAVRQEKSQLSPQHGKNVLFYPETSTVGKKKGKKSFLKRKKSKLWFVAGQKEAMAYPLLPIFIIPLFHAAKC